MAHGFRRIGRRGDEGAADVDDAGNDQSEMTNRDNVPGSRQGAGEADGANGAGNAMETLAEVGEHVAAVLTSAQQAAEQMRAEARQEADRVRAEARERAETTLEGVKRAAENTRADAEAYSANVRETADEYSAEKRGEAESYASRTIAGANEQAQEIRNAAGREANRLVAIGRRKSEALAGEVTHYEERLQRLHAVFAGMTTQLAELLETGLPSRSGTEAAVEPPGQAAEHADAEPTNEAA